MGRPRNSAGSAWGEWDTGSQAAPVKSQKCTPAAYDLPTGTNSTGTITTGRGQSQGYKRSNIPHRGLMGYSIWGLVLHSTDVPWEGGWLPANPRQRIPGDGNPGRARDCMAQGEPGVWRLWGDLRALDKVATWKVFCRQSTHRLPRLWGPEVYCWSASRKRKTCLLRPQPCCQQKALFWGTGRLPMTLLTPARGAMPMQVGTRATWALECMVWELSFQKTGCQEVEVGPTGSAQLLPAHCTLFTRWKGVNVVGKQEVGREEHPRCYPTWPLGSPQICHLDAQGGRSSV